MEKVLEKKGTDFKGEITKLEWKMFVHPYYLWSEEKMEDEVVNRLRVLSGEDREKMGRLVVRCEKILDLCREKGVGVLYDAEQ